MQLIQQYGKPTCQLVSFAMLQGKTYKEVERACLAVAQGIAGINFRTWSGVMRHKNNLFWDTMDIYCKVNNIPKPPGFTSKRKPLSNASGAPITCTYIGTLTEEKLAGKGMIVVGGKGSCHAMAYENGLIYDGNMTEPLTIEAWRAQARKYRSLTPIQIQKWEGGE